MKLPSTEAQVVRTAPHSDLIFDEVASFRVGHGGAQSLFGVQPDITTLGKIIGGGMPIGAVGGKAEALRIFDPSAGSACLSFTGTFNAHPLSMAAGLPRARSSGG